MRNREYASSVTLARSAFERWPTAYAQHSLGAALIEEGREEEAIRELQQAVAGDPTAEYTLGLGLYKEGKLDEAILHLREFLSHESLRIEVPYAHEMIGRALKGKSRYAEAEVEFRQVLAMTPANGDIYGQLADTLMRQQKFDEAATRYQQFLARRPNDVSALMQLGIAYMALGRQDDAIVQFRRVVELVPQDGAARRNLARALIEKHAYDEAEPQARQAVLLRPNDAIAHDELGLALAGQGSLMTRSSSCGGRCRSIPMTPKCARTLMRSSWQKAGPPGGHKRYHSV